MKTNRKFCAFVSRKKRIFSFYLVLQKKIKNPNTQKDLHFSINLESMYVIEEQKFPSRKPGGIAPFALFKTITACTISEL